LRDSNASDEINQGDFKKHFTEVETIRFALAESGLLLKILACSQFPPALS